MLGKLERDPDTKEVTKAGAITFNFLTVSDFSETDSSVLGVGNAALDFETDFVDLTLSFAKEKGIDDLEFIPMAARSINDLAGTSLSYT